MRTKSIQLSLFQPMDTQSQVTNGSDRCQVSNYLKTREALWRMLASYPEDMQVSDAVCKARVDFSKRKEVAL